METKPKVSWFTKPWNILGLVLVLVATVFIVASYVEPVVTDKAHVCSCNQFEGAGFKFDSIWLLFVIGALFMDTPLRGLVSTSLRGLVSTSLRGLSRLRGNNTQSTQAPETPAAQQQANKDA